MQHPRDMELSRWIVCGRSRAGRRTEICESGLQRLSYDYEFAENGPDKPFVFTGRFC